MSPAPVLEASPPEPPPGYPREFERRLNLRDGRTVLARPIVPSDQDALGYAFRTADADTLRLRFLGIPPRPTPGLIARLCTVDYRQRFALVAIDAATGHGAAVARYEPASPGVAEVAVAVDPAWRRVGLATALVELLAEAALERGLHSFDASYLAGNLPVAAIVHLVGDARAFVRQGVAEVEVARDPERVGEAVRRLQAPGRQG